MIEAGSHESYMERINTQTAAIKHLTQENARLRGALLLIREWSRPYPGFTIALGSKGAEDYFREIAHTALEST